jgi:hypothetical protein
MLDSLIDHLARLRGIGDRYYDYRGELKEIGRESKRAILSAMGCNVSDAAAIEAEITRLDGERWRRLLPPVSVLRPGHTGVVVALPAGSLEQPLDWRVALGTGGERSGRVQAMDLGPLAHATGSRASG